MYLRWKKLPPFIPPITSSGVDKAFSPCGLLALECSYFVKYFLFCQALGAMFKSFPSNWGKTDHGHVGAEAAKLFLTDAAESKTQCQNT